MLIAVCDSLNILEDRMTSEEAAKAYPIGFADIAKKVKAAAGMYLYILVHTLPLKIDKLTHVLPRRKGPW